MEITALILISIGIGAVIMNLISNADSFLPRCPVCSAKLEADLTGDWLWISSEEQLGLPLYYLKCPHCNRFPWRKPETPVKEESTVALLN
jgi:hypothetical protein